MDLDSQAEQALQDVANKTGVLFHGAERKAVKLAWLAGHKAGSDAVYAMAQEAFEHLRPSA